MIPVIFWWRRISSTSPSSVSSTPLQLHSHFHLPPPNSILLKSNSMTKIIGFFEVGYVNRKEPSAASSRPSPNFRPRNSEESHWPRSEREPQDCELLDKKFSAVSADLIFCDTRVKRKGTGHWALGTGHWALGTGHWALGTGHWARASHCSVRKGWGGRARSPM